MSLATQLLRHCGQSFDALWVPLRNLRLVSVLIAVARISCVILRAAKIIKISARPIPLLFLLALFGSWSPLNGQLSNNAILDSIQQQYTVADSNPAIDGFLRPIKRFANVGLTSVSTVLPDMGFCHRYFSVHEGRACQRMQSGEPYQVKLVGGPTTADSVRLLDMVIAAAGRPVSERDHVILTMGNRASTVECVSFFVHHIAASIDELMDDNFYDFNRVRMDSGLACQLDDVVLQLPDERRETLAEYELWDIAQIGGVEYLVAVVSEDECGYLLVSAIQGNRLVPIGEVSLACL